MTIAVPRLSLCMIVKDEEAHLEACLQSVMDWVDEAIVVDTGSQDGTVALAQTQGAQVYHYPWPGDFATARNWALERVTGDWVLVLDADETFVPEQVQPLRQLLTQETALVITLLRQEVGAAQSPYSRLSRVFRRHPQVRFARPYHALIDDSVLALRAREPQWQVLALPEVALMHWGYGLETIAARHKADRARTALETYLATHPNDPYTCAKLGALYGSLGDWPRGQALLHQGLQHLQAPQQPAQPQQPDQKPSPITQPKRAADQDSPAISPEVSPEVSPQIPPEVSPEIAYELHYHLGIAASHLGDAEAATAHYEAALNQAVDDRLKLGACNNLGSLLLNQGQAEVAQLVFEQSLEWDPQFALGYYNLGLAKKAQGDLLGAIAAYQAALRYNPNHAASYQNLGVVFLKRGQVRESIALLQRAIELHHHQGNPIEAQRLQQTLQELGLEA